MLPNPIVLAAAALIPLFIGFLWYNPKVFGTAWMNASGMTEEKVKSGNMLKIFGLTYVLSLFLGVILFTATIHQSHVFSTFVAEPTFEGDQVKIQEAFDAFMVDHGDVSRNFGHGVLHGGVLLGIFLVFPILGIIALFERKSFKYVLIHGGYWMLSLALMGGVICQFS